jgi:hypothetical protein
MRQSIRQWTIAQIAAYKIVAIMVAMALVVSYLISSATAASIAL